MRRRLIAVLSGAVMVLSLPLGAGADTTVTATMTDAIVGGGDALPGATIEYTVIITDDGDAEDAVGVVFSIPTLDSNTTLVPMSIIAYPIAVDDDYTLSATGNITTQITAAIGLLANDVDPDGGGATGACSDDPGTKCLVAEVSSSGAMGGAVIVFPATIDTNQDGSVTVQADGSFTYESPPGFTGTTVSITWSRTPSHRAAIATVQGVRAPASARSRSWSPRRSGTSTTPWGAPTMAR